LSIDPYALSRFGPSASEAKNFKLLANVFDYGVGYPAALGVAVWAAPVIPSLVSQLGEAAAVTPQALQAVIPSVRYSSTRVLIGAQLITMSVTSAAYYPTVEPEMLELLEEEMVPWEYWQWPPP
jgi:hypothetical protein